MVTNQRHLSDSTASKQEVIRHTKKLAQIFGLNEQNAEVYSALSSENWALEKRLDDYYSQYKELKKEVNRLGKHIEGRVDCLNDDVDELFAMECCNCSKESINSSSESSPSAPNIKKWPKGAVHKGSFYSSESSEESDLVEIIERPHRVQVREKKDVPHKQRRKTRPRKVKIKKAVSSSGC